MHTPNTHTPFQDLPNHQGVLCRTRDFSYLGPCTELLGRYEITPLDPFSALPDSPGSFVAQVGLAPPPRGAAIMQRDASPSARGQDPSRGDRGSQMSPQTVRIRVTKKFTRNQNFLSKAILLLKGVLQPVASKRAPSAGSGSFIPNAYPVQSRPIGWGVDLSICHYPIGKECKTARNGKRSSGARGMQKWVELRGWDMGLRNFR